MRVNLHRPLVTEIVTLDGGTHVVSITDSASHGVLDLFLAEDWSGWDRLVTAVENYRYGDLREVS